MMSERLPQKNKLSRNALRPTRSAKGGFVGRIKREVNNEVQTKGWSTSSNESSSSSSTHSSHFSASQNSASSPSTSRAGKSGVGTRSVTPNYSDYSGSNGDNYTINIGTVEQMVKRLLPFAHTKLDNLPSDILNDLSTITALTKTTTGTLAHEKIRRITLGLFGSVDPSTVQPNTVASKILGCSISKCLNVPLGCGPLCAGALNTDEQGEGSGPCQQSVYLFENNSFVVLTHGTSTGNRKAYVYVHENFVGFDQTQISQLIQNNIEMIKVVHLDADTECSQISPDFLRVETFLKDDSTDTSSVAPPSDKVNTSATSSTSSWWWVLIIVLIAIIIIGVAFYVVMKSRKNSNQTATPGAYGGVHTLQNGISAGFKGITSAGMTPPGSPVFSQEVFSSIANSMRR